MLNMSSAATVEPSPDLTARARIRDAALHLFGEVGFRAATVRRIAERAGVSAALVVHHFRSKEGLREAVEEHLVAQIREGKFAAMTGALTPDEQTMRRNAEDYAPAMAYLARALTEDAEVGRHLYDRLYRDALAYLAAGEDAGVIRTTHDPEARAAALLNAGLAQTLLQHHLLRVLDTSDPVEGMVRIAGPVLDLYTDGLFTDSRIRDAFTAASSTEGNDQP
jgi:TetR/AcrR family transcriptional regulator, regulator of cefoperazone and chloramphenicol sensitivity